MEHSWDGPVTAEEIVVANILLELPYLFFESESRRGFSFAWGAKKKRSSASKEEVAATPLPALKPSLSPPPSLPSNIGSAYETEAPVKKALASSPATPLSFFPSETDEKPLPPKKKASVNSLKEKKEQCLQMMEYFTQRHEILKREVESQRLILDQMKAENLELKAMKQKFIQGLLLEAENARLETRKSLNLEKQLTQISMETGNTTTYHHQQQRISTRVYQEPLIKDRTVCKSEINKNSQYPYASMISGLPSNTGRSSHVNENVGSIGFDLNVPADEAFEFKSLSSTDLDSVNKARAAKARLNRLQICRAKSLNAACKARCPFR